ncbi:hypothetical protein L3V86_06705 [Thiotrichales bacterium 19S11-10]|nr:hypothetical protein [Thiotrichales bacterium 19S11-10]MCF6807554.1 hypothetical protein [Thiotrichales bacterium 19S9-11]MCF6811523.1 hypothetical protein [Thiotrichales bacterium 19S9-12]
MKRLKLKPFLLFQILLVLLGSVIFFIFSTEAMVSFLLGSSILLIGNVLMLVRFFFKPVLFSAPSEVMFLFMGEFLKLLVIALGSVFVAMCIQVNFGIYLFGLVTLQIAMWMMPLFVK